MVEGTIVKAIVVLDPRFLASDKAQVRAALEMQWGNPLEIKRWPRELRAHNINAITEVEFTIAATCIEPLSSLLKGALVTAVVVRHGAEHGNVHDRILPRVWIGRVDHGLGARARERAQSACLEQHRERNAKSVVHALVRLIMIYGHLESYTNNPALGRPLSPWFKLNDADELVTPEWTFRWDQRKRWP